MNCSYAPAYKTLHFLSPTLVTSNIYYLTPQRRTKDKFLFEMTMKVNWRLEKQQKHFDSHAVSTLACRVDSLLTVLAISHIFCNLKEKETVFESHDTSKFWQRITMQINQSATIFLLLPLFLPMKTRSQIRFKVSSLHVLEWTCLTTANLRRDRTLPLNHSRSDERINPAIQNLITSCTV